MNREIVPTMTFRWVEKETGHETNDWFVWQIRTTCVCPGPIIKCYSRGGKDPDYGMVVLVIIRQQLGWHTMNSATRCPFATDCL